MDDYSDLRIASHQEHLALKAQVNHLEAQLAPVIAQQEINTKNLERLEQQLSVVIERQETLNVRMGIWGKALEGTLEQMDSLQGVARGLATGQLRVLDRIEELAETQKQIIEGLTEALGKEQVLAAGIPVSPRDDQDAGKND